MQKQPFPILEFDGQSQPIVTAKKYLPEFVDIQTDLCLITYFNDVVELYERGFKVNQVFKIRTEGVRPRVYLMKSHVLGKAMYVVPMSIGAPQAARVIESMCALGVNKFMVSGGAGALVDYKKPHRDLCNKTLLPVSALRDEGTSYHYLPPSRDVELNPIVQQVIEKTLKKEGVQFERVKTWTTDAIFRETADKVQARIDEGCDVVEMECSCYYSIAKHKGIMLGQLLYSGDSVSVSKWDYRSWHDAHEKREKLFELSAKCLLELSNVRYN
jgi:uridine phosphorylase